MITFSQLGNMGRVGNCLFQCAATISTAIKNETNYKFPHWKYEKDFNIPLNYFSDQLPKNPIYQEPYFHYACIPNWKDMELIGYLQSYKYFADHQDEIIKLLTPIHHFEKELGLCSIHIRRGDYVSQPQNHPTQSMEYYDKAMELSGCNRFLIFSDDIDWCKKHFVGNQFDFSENKNDIIDLTLMAKKCEHNIICNSSFSWWGAYLNQNSNKRVIYPSKWFGHNLSHNIKDLCPKEWKKV